MIDDEDGYHNCHFCGALVKDGISTDGKRHWLSDCRPDLVKHEPGETCTWYYRDKDESGKPNCYAFQNLEREWTDKHEHFHEDGPM